MLNPIGKKQRMRDSEGSGDYLSSRGGRVHRGRSWLVDDNKKELRGMNYDMDRCICIYIYIFNFWVIIYFFLSFGIYFCTT